MINIPTIIELHTRISNDLRNRLNLTDAQIKTVLNAFASVMSAEEKQLYLFLADIQKNLFVDTADSENIGGTLEHFGRIFLNRNPNPATQGVFNVSVVGVAGSVLVAGLGFKSNDTSKNPGQLYTLENEYTLTGSNDIIEISSNGGGVEFDLSVNNTLTITEPVIGVDSVVTVTEVVEQPLAAETLEDYRSDILLAIQLEPQGGSKTDYRVWASDAGGVRLVYPYVKNGDAGTVQVFVEATKADSSDGNGTPTQAILDDVTDVINFDPDDTKPTNERGRRPIQANLEVLEIEIVHVDVTITGLQDDSNSVRTAIQENLVTYLETVRPFVDGADLLRNKNDILYISGLQTVVVGVLTDGNFFSNFQMFVNDIEKNNHLFEKQYIPYLRNVTYI